MVVMCGQLNKGVLGLHKFFALHDQLKGGSLVEIMNVVKSLKRNAHVEAKNPEHSGIKSTKKQGYISLVVDFPLGILQVTSCWHCWWIWNIKIEIILRHSFLIGLMSSLAMTQKSFLGFESLAKDFDRLICIYPPLGYNANYDLCDLIKFALHKFNCDTLVSWWFLLSTHNQVNIHRNMSNWLEKKPHHASYI